MGDDDWKDADFLSFEKGEPTTERDDEGDMEVSSTDSNNDDAPAVGSAASTRSLPPWLDKAVDFRHVPPLTVLHNEIVAFCQLIEPTQEETMRREAVVADVRKLVHKTFGGKAEVHVFGSQATGLFLPSSDIDLVVLTTEEKKSEDSKEENHELENWDSPKGPALRRFAAAIKEEWNSNLSYLESIETTRIPLVKFTFARSNISVDVSFDQQTGPPAAQLMKTYMDALPPLRPLTFTVKYFLAARGLNQPYTGGVGSFMLQLMIVAFLQQRERDAVNFGRPTVSNLGSMLLEFFQLYGVDLNYVTTGISVRHDGFFFPKGAASRLAAFWSPEHATLCAIENPLDPTMDVGRSSFRIQLVQRAFAVAYRTLLAHVSDPVEPTTSVLATILAPTDEMFARRLYKARHRPLSAKRGPSNQGQQDSKRGRNI